MKKHNLQSFDSADGTIRSAKILGAVIAYGLLFQNIAFAQQEPGAILKVPWAMDVQASSIAISTKKATELRWYLISVGSPMKSAVEVIVDGVGSNNPVNFSGSALFWGKQIELKRYSGTESLSGTWTIANPKKNTVLGSPQWAIVPGTNAETVIAMLDMEREFIVTFREDSAKGDCQNGKLKPIVDGKVLSDAAGKDIILSQGGSIMAKGKFIRATVTGTCLGGIGFSGNLELL